MGACKQIIGGKECGWPATCAAPGETCYDSVDGKPPLTCCGDSVCTQIIGGKQCQYPDTCALPLSRQSHAMLGSSANAPDMLQGHTPPQRAPERQNCIKTYLGVRLSRRAGFLQASRGRCATRPIRSCLALPKRTATVSSRPTARYASTGTSHKLPWPHCCRRPIGPRYQRYRPPDRA